MKGMGALEHIGCCKNALDEVGNKRNYNTK